MKETEIMRGGQIDLTGCPLRYGSDETELVVERDTGKSVQIKQKEEDMLGMMKKHWLVGFFAVLIFAVAGCSLQNQGEQQSNPLSSIQDENDPALNPDSDLLIDTTDQVSKFPDKGIKPASALSDYWRNAVWREICYALSATKYNQRQYGQSTRTKYWAGGLWLVGDWNYRGWGVGIGGNCKQFAAEIVRRATGGRYRLPTGYRYATGNIAYCRPGDIIQRSDIYGTPHTAIVFAVLARDSAGRATKIDVIDANFVGGMGSNLIARHILPTSSFPLSQFRVW